MTSASNGVAPPSCAAQRVPFTKTLGAAVGAVEAQLHAPVARAGELLEAAAADGDAAGRLESVHHEV